MSILDGINLPYKTGESPGQTTTPTTPTTPTTQQPAAPGGILKDVNLPYKQGESPGGQTTVAPTAPTAPISWPNYLYDIARTAGNEAVIPNALNRGLSLAEGTDYATQAARTAQAERELGPVATTAARGVGQYANVSRFIPYVGSNPVFQGVVSGAGRKLMEGDFNPVDVAKQAALEASLSYGGAAIGKYISGGTKTLTDRNPQELYEAAGRAAESALNKGDWTGWTKNLENQAGIESLQKLSQAGSDTIKMAKDYASSATGAAKDAYQNIAKAAAESGIPGWVRDAASGATAWGVHQLSGDIPLAGTSYLLAKRGLNWAGKTITNTDIQHAIDSSFPAVANAVKTTVNPETYGQVGGALARGALDDAGSIYSGAIKPAIDWARTQSPTAWLSGGR